MNIVKNTAFLVLFVCLFSQSQARSIAAGGVSNLHQEYFYQDPFKTNTPQYYTDSEGEIQRIESIKILKSAPYKSDYQKEKDQTSKIYYDRLNLVQSNKDTKSIEKRIKNVVQSTGLDPVLVAQIETKDDETLRLQKKLRGQDFRTARTSDVPGSLRKTSFPDRGSYSYFPGASESPAISNTRKSIQQQ